LNYHSTRSPPHASPPSGRSDEGTKTWESVWRKKEMNEGKNFERKSGCPKIVSLKPHYCPWCGTQFYINHAVNVP